MLTFTFPKALRVTDGKRAVTVYAPKPLEVGDILVQSTPEEVASPNVLSWPGEYDMAGITFRGVGHDEGRQVSFLMIHDGVRCALPSLPLRAWTPEEIEQLGDIDVLAVVGEDAKVIQSLVDEIDPRVLILLPGKDGVAADVLKACGALEKEHVSEYKLKGLPQEGREVVVFA